MISFILTYVLIWVSLMGFAYIGYQAGKQAGTNEAVAVCYKMGAHGCARKVKKELL